MGCAGIFCRPVCIHLSHECPFSQLCATTSSTAGRQVYVRGSFKAFADAMTSVAMRGPLSAVNYTLVVSSQDEASRIFWDWGL